MDINGKFLLWNCMNHILYKWKRKIRSRGVALVANKEKGKQKKSPFPAELSESSCSFLDSDQVAI